MEEYTEEEMDLAANFAAVSLKIARIFDKSIPVEDLESFLKFLCHPHAKRLYINPDIYQECETSGKILEKLYPLFINFLNTGLLRRIVFNLPGPPESQKLLQEYEDAFPRKKPLKRLREPLSEQEIDQSVETKKVKVSTEGDANFTDIKDVENVKNALEESTTIDQDFISYVKQTPGSVIFTFLVPSNMVELFHDLSTHEGKRKCLADCGILAIEVDDMVFQIQCKTFNFDPKRFSDSGCKMMLIKRSSSLQAEQLNEFTVLSSQTQEELEGLLDVDEFKEYLDSFSHLLYPECKYITPRLLGKAKTVADVFMVMKPYMSSFLHWDLLRQIANNFHCPSRKAVELYAGKFPPTTTLISLPDPFSEEEIAEFPGVRRLRLSCSNVGSDWTLGDVMQTQEAVERATGISKSFLPFAYWESSLHSHQFTFLIPETINAIFSDLCNEDLAILAECGIQTIEIDYDYISTNVQVPKSYCEEVTMQSPSEEIYTQLKKHVGLPDLISNNTCRKQMSNEDYSTLTRLVDSTPDHKCQEVCSDDFLRQLALKMDSWTDLAPYLGITDHRQHIITQEFPKEEDQKYQALLSWKKVDQSTATYETLTQCLLQHGHVQEAMFLLKDLCSTSDEPPTLPEMKASKVLEDFPTDGVIKEVASSENPMEDLSQKYSSSQQSTASMMPETMPRSVVSEEATGGSEAEQDFSLSPSVLESSAVSQARKWLIVKYQTHNHFQRSARPNTCRLMEFNYMLGQIKKDPSELLAQIDYSTYHETLDQFPESVTTVSMKSLVNVIASHSKPSFLQNDKVNATIPILIKGLHGMGKSSLISRLCQYWAQDYGLRKILLVLWVNISTIQTAQITTLYDLLQLLLPSKFLRNICSWIEARDGQSVLFILDGWNRRQETASSIFSRLVSRNYLKRCTMVVTSVFTPSLLPSHEIGPEWNKTVVPDYTQFDMLGLTPSQINQQITKYYTTDQLKAEEFLRYIAIHPDIEQMTSVPIYFHGLLFSFDHIPALELPTSWTELFSAMTLLQLIPFLPECEVEKHFSLYMKNFPHHIPEAIRAGLYSISEVSYLGLKNGTNLYSEASLADQPLLTSQESSGLCFMHQECNPLRHATAVNYFRFTLPLLQDFLAALHVHTLPLSEQKQLMESKQSFLYLRQFYSGLTATDQYREHFLILKNTYSKHDYKTVANCCYEAKKSTEIEVNIEHCTLSRRDVHHLVTLSHGKPNMEFSYCSLALVHLSKLYALFLPSKLAAASGQDLCIK